jgi:hypothetical protein
MTAGSAAAAFAVIGSAKFAGIGALIAAIAAMVRQARAGRGLAGSVLVGGKAGVGMEWGGVAGEGRGQGERMEAQLPHTPACVGVLHHT